MSSESTTLQKNSERALRYELQTILIKDLMGPAGAIDEELAEARVSDRYLVGALAPAGEIVTPEELDGVGEGGPLETEDGKSEEVVPSKTAFIPSSIGLTFSVDVRVSAIAVTVRWGRYERTVANSGSERVWKRIPFEQNKPDFVLREGVLERWEPDPEIPEIRVQGLARKREDQWVVTLFLVNGQTPKKRLKDEAWLFQVGMDVACPDGSCSFFRRKFDVQRDQVTEQGILEMLYRDVSEFAVGHGVSVHAETDPDNPLRARKISTTFLPEYEVPLVSSPDPEEIPPLSGLKLDMKELSDLQVEEIDAGLLPLIRAYAEWIDGLRSRAKNLSDWKQEADSVIQSCTNVLQRIENGMELLRKDSDALEAFRFMNAAMWRQRIHSILSQSVRRGNPITFESIDLPQNRRWYPFQLAFILMNLPSLCDLNHPDRRADPSAIADLLWFPTGGGKTEAYLGLAAFAMVIRRLQGDVEGRSGEYGVSVLMRYTLRLLTVQQFQRAATLICACEDLRRQKISEGDQRFGANPFRIGLWVGKGVTPNTTDQSYEAIRMAHGETFRKYGGSSIASIGTPYQLMSCPWCGTKIDPGKDIEVERFNEGRARTLLYCGDLMGRCLFSRRNSPGEGLPVIVVDEEIYRNLPALVIATADKFAQMPWKGEVQTLFGIVTGRCERHGFRSPELDDSDSHPKTKNGKYPPARTVSCNLLRPPDLIIQDELHLISGPLGTLVGLYETAIDHLSTWNVNGKEVRPKLIASTATIRRASKQVKALYAREVQIFPPTGLNAGDNFFARQRQPSDETPGRMYVGICAPGRRMKAALIRTYFALMAGAQTLYDKYGKRADPWMTLVGYFNSIRELGGARRVLDDDIATRLKRADRRGLKNRTLYPDGGVQELTSRKSSTEIPQILDRLEVPFDPEGRGMRPLDAVLATNMVSVGVDVSRLGLMVVCGQPKTTSEYIQATSRVGRRHPGLVVTLYNWARPRDLSHYERFEYYHATFYKHVEALSVTPFSRRAMDRGLSAVLVALLRLGGVPMNPNPGATLIIEEEERLQKVLEDLIERSRSGYDHDEIPEEVRELVQERIDLWRSIAEKSSSAYPLGYSATSKTRGLLEHAGVGDWSTFTCLDSLRDVENTVGLILRDDERLNYSEQFQTQADARAENEEET